MTEKPEDFEQTSQRIDDVIDEFENGTIPLAAALAKLQELSGKTVEQYELENYWRSEDRGMFSRRLAIQPIQDWQAIDDSRALQLVEEINADPCNDPIIERNLEALAKRYGKTEEQLLEIVQMPASEAIAALNTDTRTIL